MRVCVVGMGYVGLPTAVLLAKAGYLVVGCDTNHRTVAQISQGLSPLKDLNIEADVRRLVNVGRLRASSQVADEVSKSDIVLIVVPTPLKAGFEPDLGPLVAASESVAAGMRRGQIVVVESTVYPGATEEMVKPILEEAGLTAGKDFGLMYCPERYNPGDGKHTVDKVTRVIGGIGDNWVRCGLEFYNSFTNVRVVKDIMTAEMAKIIENTQRDLNIALMNEVALICEKLGLDVMAVIDAAATKWNFHVYYPGAGVGGHCLPKDPWYLVRAAENHGLHPQVIVAGRRMNDSMPGHILGLLIDSLNQIDKSIRGSRILILGLSYKEGVGDLRNSPSVVLVRKIAEMGGTVHSVDPYVSETTALSEAGVDYHYESLGHITDRYDGIVVMTAHDAIAELTPMRLKKWMGASPVLVDGRRLFSPEKMVRAGFIYRGVGRGNDAQQGSASESRRSATHGRHR